MFLILLPIKQQFEFPLYPMYASALPGKKQSRQNIRKNEQKVNKILSPQICGLQLPVEYKVQLHLTVCVPNNNKMFMNSRSGW